MFKKLDLKDDDMKEELAGTTAICVLIKDKKLYCVSGSNLNLNSTLFYC